jgi:hypothetical protein
MLIRLGRQAGSLGRLRLQLFPRTWVISSHSSGMTGVILTSDSRELILLCWRLDRGQGRREGSNVGRKRPLLNLG